MNRGIVAIVIVALTPMVVVPLAAGTADAATLGGGAPKRVPYHEVIRRSSVIVIGKCGESSIVEVEQFSSAAPRPEPGTTLDEPPSLLSASFLREELSDSKKLFAYRVKLEVTFSARGGIEQKSVLDVNLAYGKTKGAVEQLAQTAIQEALQAPDVQMVVHLRDAPDPTRRSRSWELVITPWALKAKDLETKSREMMVRMTRYAAFLQIDMMINNFEELKEGDLLVLRSLAAGKGANMGTVKNVPIEQKLLDAALNSEDKSETAVKAWKTWWSADRFVFVAKPFSIVANGEKSDTGDK